MFSRFRGDRIFLQPSWRFGCARQEGAVPPRRRLFLAGKALVDLTMMPSFSTRLQTALVVVLFLASLSALLFNAVTTRLLPRQETEVRQRLREASRRMIESAEPIDESMSNQPAAGREELNQQLYEVADEVLKDFQGIEGGFYQAGSDRFAGCAFPTDEHRKDTLPRRNDPPPLETPYLRVQSNQSLDLESGEYLVSTREVGPSKVVFLTEPVGSRRPARLVGWVMYRLVGPEQLASQLSRYALSSSLALGGIVLSLALTWNLGRTLRRQRQEEERLRDELRRAEHLAALGRLLAGVAHEVRNPLAGIRSTVQLWQRLPDTARSPASLEAIVSSVDRLDAIVARLLYFSRADNAQREPVDLNHVVNESLDLLAAQAASQDVLLERNLADDLPTINASGNAIRQVALNLYSNALQAMPKSGRLICITRQRPREGQVEMLVEDTGHGISAQDQQHLFVPFFTTRPEGTGLGLALCREIILAHGGQIELAASSSAGTLFRVLLPAAPSGGATHESA
jgi:two-component system, NtrC family, sensor histidine kinase HydH